ncbi:CxC2 domain-containing protein [Mycena chlorophos]|uniref:CxC2 domain-containing protein n=1 Tax=Mycena chlorophos TaxID=658473 RepID=A0A8H6SVQ5_MYCCL|nr:CxC2 domain-containing protein [Mycena chlorophos]
MGRKGRDQGYSFGDGLLGANETSFDEGISFSNDGRRVRTVISNTAPQQKRARVDPEPDPYYADWTPTDYLPSEQLAEKSQTSSRPANPPRRRTTSTNTKSTRVKSSGRNGGDMCPRFLYALLLALDANFRLKNRIRANEHQDPSLGSGWGYFVEDEDYKEHLSDYVAEVDVSTCIAFAALMQKDTRQTAGLRVSGVGGCVCARHGVVRAQGLGDLQKGERYANMDYILMQALTDERVEQLVLSYDISCQWKIHLRERVKKIVQGTGAKDLEAFRIRFALPVWHAAAHEISCREALSLSHAPGVGRTDGEGIERTWAVLNPISFATKEMGAGNRLDTIEDKVDHVNFEKNIGQGDALARKLIIATAERDKQLSEFVDLDRSIEPTVRRDWQSRLDAWIADDTKPNPYLVAGGKDAGPSEAQVAADLKKAEVEEAREGRGDFVEAKTTATGFVKGLLQLEDLKRRIKNEVRGSTKVTAERSSQIEELRASFFKKLQVVEQLQDVFMPGVRTLRAKAERNRDTDLPPVKAEDTKLWLPSDVKANQRGWVAKKGVSEVEAKLRLAQCGDALQRLRSLLYAKTHVIYQRNLFSVGQAANTRSSTLLSRLQDRIDREVAKFNEALTALRRLEGEGAGGRYQILTKNDLRVRVETESDAQARTRLGRVGSARPARNEPSSKDDEDDEDEDDGKKKGVSWIWFTPVDEEEVEMHEAVRVEWTKALTRRDRWVEEVRLVREEMLRVLRSLRSIQAEWKQRETTRRTNDASLQLALTAYARRQAALYAGVAAHFYTGWTTDKRPAARQVLMQDAERYRELVQGHVSMEE